MRNARLRVGLVVKLLAVHLTAIVLAIVVVWLAIELLAAEHFMTLAERYGIKAPKLQEMFFEAVHRYILLASLIAVFSGAALALWLTRHLLAPMSRMTRVSEEIASGKYSERVGYRSGDEVGRLALAFDRMADGLEQVEELRQQIVIDVAHELRTPLTNVRAHLEALRDGVLPPSPEAFGSLEEEARRLGRLVDDMLELAHAEAASRTLAWEPVDLHALVERSLAAFEDELGRREIAVSNRVPTVSIQADPDKLHDVLRNLAENAARYTRTGGALVITLEALPAAWRILFENASEPLSDEELARLFERFYRPERNGVSVPRGSGVGLAIVERLVRVHGGEVGAERGPGTTRVWFTIPRRPPEG